jgi:hypothetical protein
MEAATSIILQQAVLMVCDDLMLSANVITVPMMDRVTQ